MSNHHAMNQMTPRIPVTWKTAGQSNQSINKPQRGYVTAAPTELPAKIFTHNKAK